MNVAEIFQFFESPHFAGVSLVGAVIGLAGLAYRDVTRRLSKCEKDNQALIPMVTRIDANVANIEKHCKHCK